MKLSLSLLKKYLNTTATVAEISDTLTRIGLEVDEVVDLSSQLDGFVVAEIKEVGPHPNADKLHVLKVFDGKEDLQIVCGAPNCRVGMKSVLAKEGCLIPKYNEKLRNSKIRGVDSCGMLCAEDELCLGNDHTGIMDLTTDLPAGTPAAQALAPDVVFDITVTPNRPDCYGAKGMARDLAAAGIGTYTPHDAKEIAGTFASPVQVKITTANCPVFVGRYIKNVANKPSPDWMQKILLSVGLRPISALVDITNYLNIAECRPLHVFDADKLTGNITIRNANNGEKITCLDNKEYTLDDSMVVVADDKNAQSIAGIMGGVDTSVSMDTKNIFLESAYFEPMSIAKTGRKTGAESDSRQRFERGVDPASAYQDSLNATQMILDMCGGEVSEPVVAGQLPDTTQIITFDWGLVKKLTDLDIPQATMENILVSLGFGVKGNQISVPSWRFHDVKRPADVIEEIVRIYGLDTLPEKPVRAERLPIGVLTPAQKRESAVRRALAEQGLYQAITWSFMDSKLAKLFDSKDLKLVNPIASDLDELRPSLLPNLLCAIKRNQDHGTNDVQLFEVGPEFFSAEPNQQRLVAAGVRAGKNAPRHFAQTERDVDVFDAKADALAALNAAEAPVNMQITTDAPSWYHPGRSGCFRLGKNMLAVFGQIHPQILKKLDIKTAVVGFEVYLDNIPMGRKKSKMQPAWHRNILNPITRDFAFVMDKNVSADKLCSAIANADKALITTVRIFDVYEGDKLPVDKKSIAVEVTIQPQGDQTLTNEDIEILSARIVSSATKATGATLRS